MLGADINYIVTGTASVGTDKVSRQEKELIESYRSAEKSVRAFAIGGMSCVLAVELFLDSCSNSPDNIIIPEESFAERIRQERELIGLSQRELSRKLGFNNNKVNRFESESVAPKALDIQAFSSLGIDVNYLVLGYFLTSLSKEERALVANYKLLPIDTQRAVNAALSFK